MLLQSYQTWSLEKQINTPSLKQKFLIGALSHKLKMTYLNKSFQGFHSELILALLYFQSVPQCCSAGGGYETITDS